METKVKENKNWEKSPLLWVSGKGGVGKTQVALALAHRAHLQGQKVLFVELGERSHIERMFNITLSQEPQRSPLGFEMSLWTGESCLREYILHYLKVESVYKIFFENKIMRTFLEVAPAVKELAITGKATSGPRGVGPQLPYDKIIIDAFSTGHMLALFQSPQGMAEAIQGGPMGKESQGIMNVLKNPDLSHVVVVTLPEELPTIEALEFQAAMSQLIGAQGISALLNKALPLTEAQKRELDVQLPDHGIVSHLQLQNLRQQKALQRLKEGFPGPISEIPFIFSQDAKILVEKMGESLRNN